MERQTPKTTHRDTNPLHAIHPGHAALQPRTRLTVLVPTHDNAGRIFSAPAIDEFELFASRLAGGLTYLGLARGLWWSAGTLFRDRNHWYVANVLPHEARAIVTSLNDYIVEKFAQEAAYIEVADTLVTPIEGVPASIELTA